MFALPCMGARAFSGRSVCAGLATAPLAVAQSDPIKANRVSAGTKAEQHLQRSGLGNSTKDRNWSLLGHQAMHEDWGDTGVVLL